MKHSQGADALVKLYESKLCEEDAVNGDIKSIDAVMSTLKVSRPKLCLFSISVCSCFSSSSKTFLFFQQWRSEIDDRRDVFHDLEDELQKARGTSDRMFKTHNERDFDLDWHKEKTEQLGERWRNVHSQIENRSVWLYLNRFAVILSPIYSAQIYPMFKCANICQTSRPRRRQQVSEIL